MYQPTLGRFLSRDPLPDGANALLYSFPNDRFPLLSDFSANTPLRRMSMNQSRQIRGQLASLPSQQLNLDNSGRIPAALPGLPPAHHRPDGERPRATSLWGPHPYAYAANNPIRYVDPSGLEEDECEYYADKCRCTSWWNFCQVLYYCLAADLVCKNAGNGAWRDCVRRCLQSYDDGRGQLIRDGNVPILGTVIGCLEHAPLEVIDHVICFAVCRWDTTSY
jgi:hypothetical protein